MPSWTSLPDSSVAAALEADPRSQTEREIGLRDAYALVRSCLTVHDIEVFVDDHAGFAAAYADIKVLDAESKYTHGAVKGDRCEAVVGAMAELTEHFFSGPDHFIPATARLAQWRFFNARPQPR